MSLHFIIDGYNIIKNNPALNKTRLKDSRAALIKFIEEKRPQGSARNNVTVVFDGQPDIFYYRKKENIEIIFSKGESADDKIKEMVVSSRQPRNLCVVTDDREICYFARIHGANFISVAEFIGKTKKENKADLEFKAELSYGEVERINAELRKIWLGADEGQE